MSNKPNVKCFQMSKMANPFLIEVYYKQTNYFLCVNCVSYRVIVGAGIKPGFKKCRGGVSFLFTVKKIFGYIGMGVLTIKILLKGYTPYKNGKLVFLKLFTNPQ